MSDLGYAFSRRMAASGVRYADVMISPVHWTAWNRKLPALVDALHEGFLAAEQDGLTPVGLCISLSRNQSASSALEIVETLTAPRHPRVVALSIDGNEMTAGRTGPRFVEAFAAAGRAGLRRTVHAGESSGPEGVRDAVEILGADRIDHGVRAIEDASVMALLAERRIPLGICPTSNLTLGLYAKLEDHPIDRLRRAGVPVSVNTDDPALLDVTLQKEYAGCANAFGWDKETLRGVAATSIQASFADMALKQQMMSELAGW
jgi:adenosine deaminase